MNPFDYSYLARMVDTLLAQPYKHCAAHVDGLLQRLDALLPNVLDPEARDELQALRDRLQKHKDMDPPPPHWLGQTAVM